MSLKDKINNLADRFHVGTDGYDPGRVDEGQPEEEFYEEDLYYGDQPAYEEAPQAYPQDEQDERIEFESGFGTGGGYSAAGARPASKKSKGGMRGILERVRSYGRQEPEPRIPEKQRPSNVIPMRSVSQEAPQPRYRTEAPAPRYEQEFYEEPQEAAPRMDGRTSATMIYLVRRLEDAEDIISHMLEGGSVIVNMEEIDDVLKRRVLDVVSGAAYALEASVRRISYRNYFVAPNGEEIVSNVTVRDREALDDGGAHRYR